jgi:chromosome segregation ATPase
MFILVEMISAAAAPSPDPYIVIWVALITGGLSLLGTGVLAVLSLRGQIGKKYSDSREDKSAEVADLKTATDAALELADKERQSKESAVATLEKVVGALERQVEQLTTNVTNLTETINVMTGAATMQRDLLARITTDRDELAATLAAVEIERDSARKELDAARHEIYEMTYPSVADAIKVKE